MRRGQTWRKEGRRKRGGEDEEEQEGGRGGQGLSVEKTAMKGNCHAPVLTQEHLSQEEHAKCAGHVPTTPPLFYTLAHIDQHASVHTHTKFLRKGLMLHHFEGITFLTACQSSCHWLLRICKEKLG